MKNSCNYWFIFLRAIVLVKNGKHGYLLENWGIQLCIRLSFEYILGRARKPWFLEPLFWFFLESFWDKTVNPNYTYLQDSIDPWYFFSVVWIQASFEYTKKYVCNFLAAFCTAIVIIHRSSVRRQLVLLWDIS